MPCKIRLYETDKFDDKSNMTTLTPKQALEALVILKKYNPAIRLNLDVYPFLEILGLCYGPIMSQVHLDLLIARLTTVAWNVA